MPSLLDLPPELIHHVYDFAGTSTVCRLRLTCRALCRLGDDHLLPEVNAYMHLRSLNTLEEVASSRPAIRNAIKSLFFQTDGTNFWLEHHANRDRRRFDIWHALRQRAHETEGPRYISLLANHNTKDDAGRNAVVYAALLNCHSTNERANHDYPRPDADEPSDDAWQSAPRDDEARKDPQLISAFEHYKKLTKDEIRMSSESLVQAKLMGLFRSCPNLTKLSFNVKDILRRNNAFESPEWLRGLFVPHGATFQQPAAFMQTMSAAYDASVKLLDLSVGYGPELLDSFGDDERLHLALKDLTRLHWRVESADPWGNGNTGDFRDFSTSLCRGYLRQITSSCQKMQCLYLDMMHHPLDTHRAWLEAIISSDLVFQHLRHLRITNFQASPDQLSSLLLRHAKTLESLHLHNVHLRNLAEFSKVAPRPDTKPDENGTLWQTCIEAFAGQMPALRKVRLTGRFTSFASNGTWFYGRRSSDSSGEGGHESSSSEVIDYILTGTSKYYFPAPSFDGDSSRLDPSLDSDSEHSSNLSLDDALELSLDNEDTVTEEEDESETDDAGREGGIA